MSQEYKLSISIFRPRVCIKNPIYRIYVDDDLLTERTYMWSDPSYVEENIIVLLDSGKHTLRIEPAITEELENLDINKMKFFRLFHFKINGDYAPLSSSGEFTI